MFLVGFMVAVVGYGIHRLAAWLSGVTIVVCE